jgi:hypothetical protein
MELVHPAADAFAVDRPALAAQHRGEAAIAVGGPFAGQIEERRLEHGLGIRRRLSAVVDRAARHAE